MYKKNILLILGSILIVVIVTFLLKTIFKVDKYIDKKGGNNINKIEAVILDIEEDYNIKVKLGDESLYTFRIDNIKASIGQNITIEYTGNLDENKKVQDVKIENYILSDLEIPYEFDNGIFSKYYLLANNKLKELTLDEKIGQIFLVRYPSDNAEDILKKYKFGGYIFFEKDFKNKTEKSVKSMISKLQDVANIPIITAVDEEGGKVVRVSSNQNLANEKFKSPRELYVAGGFDSIRQDTIKKSEVLSNLGINLNLAPVVDVSTNDSDYMYSRSLGEDGNLTSIFAKTVIEASKENNVSYALKHFPGYGNNKDTHIGSSIDKRTYEDILNNDILPFKSGIGAGAEAVLVSHNIVSSIDPENPASLSVNIHNLLRNDLSFTGIIITDDLSMGAISFTNNATVKAILAGNDLIITTDYVNSIESVKKSIQDGTLSENTIDKLAFRILAWKYYKGLIK